MPKFTKYDLLYFLGDSSDSFTTYILNNTTASNNLKWQFEQQDYFNLGTTSNPTKLALKLIALRNAGVIAVSDFNVLANENTRRYTSKLAPLAASYILYAINAGFGYEVTAGRTKVRQDYAPCIAGFYNMTNTEASLLADYIVQRVTVGLHWGVTLFEIEQLWNGTKTGAQLVQAALDAIAAES